MTRSFTRCCASFRQQLAPQQREHRARIVRQTAQGMPRTVAHLVGFAVGEPKTIATFKQWFKIGEAVRDHNARTVKGILTAVLTPAIVRKSTS